MISSVFRKSTQGSFAAALLIPRRHRLQKPNQQTATISQGYAFHKHS